MPGIPAVAVKHPEIDDFGGRQLRTSPAQVENEPVIPRGGRPGVRSTGGRRQKNAAAQSKFLALENFDSGAIK